METEKKYYCNCNYWNHISAAKRLFRLIRCGENELTIQALVQEGVDIEAKNSKGFTPLLLATALGRKTIAELLIKYGANVDCRENTAKTTVLHHASRNGIEWLDIVQLIVKRISDLEERDILGMTALHHAAYYGNLEIVKLLVEAGADINARNNKGKSTPLLIAAERYHREVVQLLLNVGARFDFCNLDLLTLWHYAAGNGWLDVAQFLANRIPDLEVREKNGFSALHIASFFGQLEIVKYLVKLKVDINARSNIGDTPLLIACQLLNFDIAEYLLQVNASCDIVNTQGKSALYFLITMPSPNVKLIKLFLEKTPRVLPVEYDLILNNYRLKVDILQDVEICSQVIVNKYNNHDLPEVYKLPAFGSLPTIERMQVMRQSEVFKATERAVTFEIQTKGHCSLFNVHPKMLKALCVESVLKYYKTKL